MERTFRSPWLVSLDFIRMPFPITDTNLSLCYHIHGYTHTLPLLVLLSNRQSWGALTACCPEPAVPNPASLLQRTPERADNLSQLHRHKRGDLLILGRPQSTWKVNFSNVSRLCPGKLGNRLIQPKLLTHRILSNEHGIGVLLHSK